MHQLVQIDFGIWNSKWHVQSLAHEPNAAHIKISTDFFKKLIIIKINISFLFLELCFGVWQFDLLSKM